MGEGGEEVLSVCLLTSQTTVFTYELWNRRFGIWTIPPHAPINAFLRHAPSFLLFYVIEYTIIIFFGKTK